MATASVEATPELVSRAWCDVLETPHVGSLSWEESGGDSLATLNLLLALEKSLGRKLSFDLIQPDMTALQLSAALAPSATATGASPGEMPTVFLFPGMFGDEPRLAAFRRAFDGRLRFELVEHPDVMSPRALLSDLAATGRLAAAVVHERRPAGPLCLAGYSFGGAVALEAARHLQAGEREIAFLGIVDTPLDAARPLREPLRRLVLRPLGHYDASRRALFRVIALLGQRWSLAGRRRLLRNYRRAALQRWRPAPLPVPSLLVVSQFGDALAAGWLRLCPGMGVLRLAANHDTVFDPASLAVLAPAFESALRAGLDACPAETTRRHGLLPNQ